MLKPTFLNVLLYILVKYIAFYFFLMIIRGDYKLLEGDVGGSLAYFFIMMLPLPILSMVLTGVILYFSFKAKNSYVFFLIVISALMIDYFVYTHLASPSNLVNGIYNEAVGIVFFVVFFYGAIMKKIGI